MTISLNDPTKEKWNNLLQDNTITFSKHNSYSGYLVSLSLAIKKVMYISGL